MHSLNPGFHIMILRVCDTIGDQSASRCRHMETFVPSVCGGLWHTVGAIGKVESSSTFPTIMTLPTKTIIISNGNVCLGRPAAYWGHTIVCVETHVMYMHCPIRLDKNAWGLFGTKGTLVFCHCDRKWGHVPAVSATWRRPIADHGTDRVADQSHTIKIIWKPGLKLCKESRT